MEEEIWKPLVYHGEYFGDTHEISNFGNLRNAQTKKMLHPSKDEKGYLRQTISRGAKRCIGLKIHRAVAENFIEGDKTLGVNHKDCNKLNNHVGNLEFATAQENNEHASRHGLFPHKLEREDLEKIVELRNSGKKIYEIANILGFSKSTIGDFLRGETYKHHKDLLALLK